MFRTEDGARAVIALSIAIPLTTLLTSAVIRLAWRLHIVDTPDLARRIHRAPVPRVGGIAVFIGAVASVFLVSPGSLELNHGHRLGAVLLGASLMFLVGLADDIRGLSPLAKFAGQLATAIVVVVAGGFPTSIAFLQGSSVHVGWAGAPLLVLWIVGVTNAYNLIDGLNGLAAGIGIVACLAVTLIAMVSGQHTLVPGLALLGALIGFSRYNYPQARIFLGDSGTMSIGFLLSILLVRSSTDTNGSCLLLVPVFAMMVPILDTTLAVVRRWLRHAPLSGADARHIHHRLIAAGFSQPQSAVVLWAVAVAFSAFGFAVALAAPSVGAACMVIGFAVFVGVVVHAANRLAYHELRIAGDVLVQGPLQVRRMITDRILAADLGESIEQAESVRAINALLARGAATFGFRQIELHAEHRTRSGSIKPRAVAAPNLNGTWRLDFYLDSGVDADVMLSIVADHLDARISGAERVARVLVPCIESWIESGRGVDQSPKTNVVSPTHRRRQTRSNNRPRLALDVVQELLTSLEPERQVGTH